MALQGYTYIIEHMEDDDNALRPIPPWVQLEYAHMRTLAGHRSRVLFTNLSTQSAQWLKNAFAQADAQISPGSEASKTHLAPVECYTASVLDIPGRPPLEKICLLDPRAPGALSPSDADKFDWFLFGGILGDDPPRDRTAELRKLGFPGRHLGDMQMTTDTALGVTKRVVEDGAPLDKIPYVEGPTIRFNAKESVEMPFKYMTVEGADEPLLPPGMRELLREDLNKSFEF
ncbi:DUF431-domain-containing protein [Fistulina hepatica ATCC 64428]|uniref:DUF431-domain-containing protein n=1 Tax=Fistulina hepatica ATCC 64428 TaxID=1128425 RepID=A0A0D7AQ45_9AGAR|nr:DUF431-domain-containing protein [Fistulina hepatica ATCC 64428]